jgi:hypothetical protein
MANISTKSYWALSALSVSNLRALPDHTSELVSQAMMGTPLKVMEFADKFYRVETPEHYMGWMDAKGLQLLREQEMMAWKRSERYFYNSISGCAFQTADPKSAIVSDLVLGDVIEGEPDSNGFLKMRFPDGRIGYAGRDECISFQDWISMEPDVGSVLSFALQMLGFPYLWGGASSKASDCSGFGT